MFVALCTLLTSTYVCSSVVSRSAYATKQSRYKMRLEIKVILHQLKSNPVEKINMVTLYRTLTLKYSLSSDILQKLQINQGIGIGSRQESSNSGFDGLTTNRTITKRWSTVNASH